MWRAREYRNYDEDADLAPHNLILTFRAIRQWVRSGAGKFDLDATIHATASQGLLNVQERPERRNAVKVSLFLDSGGAMDGHKLAAQALFSAAKAEFRQLSFFYFQNCLYEDVWTDNARRITHKTPIWNILRRFGPEYRAIFVGDAAMSPMKSKSPVMPSRTGTPNPDIFN